MSEKDDKERRPIGSWSPEFGFEPLEFDRLDHLSGIDNNHVNIVSAPNDLGMSSIRAVTIETTFAIKPTPEPAKRPVRIEPAPGFALHRWLSSICPPKFREQVLDALLAESFALYCEKLDAGDRWGAWRVRWSMVGWMLWSVGGGAVGALTSLIFGKASTPPR